MYLPITETSYSTVRHTASNDSLSSLSATANVAL